jgi:hypothetical protein
MSSSTSRRSTRALWRVLRGADHGQARSPASRRSLALARRRQCGACRVLMSTCGRPRPFGAGEDRLLGNVTDRPRPDMRAGPLWGSQSRVALWRGVSTSSEVIAMALVPCLQRCSNTSDVTYRVCGRGGMLLQWAPERNWSRGTAVQHVGLNRTRSNGVDAHVAGGRRAHAASTAPPAHRVQ